MKQEIVIEGLRLTCHVGVPDEERAVSQQLVMDVRMQPMADWNQLEDDISRTIDYAAVVAELENLAQAKPRRLIETLAVDAVDWLMTRYPIAWVNVKIEKMILPQTRCVAVVVEKNR
jgi:7,8-dihydroneopterin aldolase/epimerase/oxygenase